MICHIRPLLRPFIFVQIISQLSLIYRSLEGISQFVEDILFPEQLYIICPQFMNNTSHALHFMIFYRDPLNF